MTNMLEIRWHGRGGQGAKTAALLLAEAAAAAGKHVQAFPEYGPERMGAPVVSYNRISDTPITLHSAVLSPGYVAVLDPTFIGSIDFTAGMPENGALLVNTDTPALQLRERLGLQNDSIKVYTIDATGISEANIGRPIPNTSMLGAMVAVAQVMELDDLLQDTERRLEKKFHDRPRLIQGNLAAITQAYKEVECR
ncbi:MAG: pyruvate synthase [Firmicutes bacterium]|nr:pyruvate synthase [Bacillota bacterium]